MARNRLPLPSRWIRWLNYGTVSILSFLRWIDNEEFMLTALCAEKLRMRCKVGTLQLVSIVCIPVNRTIAPCSGHFDYER